MAWKSIFLGPGGYRAGWRFLLFFAMFFGLTLAFQELLAYLVRLWKLTVPPWPNPDVLIAQDGAVLVAVLAATWIMARLEGRSLRDYGIPGRDSFSRPFWAG